MSQDPQHCCHIHPYMMIVAYPLKIFKEFKDQKHAIDSYKVKPGNLNVSRPGQTLTVVTSGIWMTGVQSWIISNQSRHTDNYHAFIIAITTYIIVDMIRLQNIYSVHAKTEGWGAFVAITCGGNIVSYLELKTICDVTDPQLRRNLNATLLRCCSKDGLRRPVLSRWRLTTNISGTSGLPLGRVR